MWGQHDRYAQPGHDGEGYRAKPKDLSAGRLPAHRERIGGRQAHAAWMVGALRRTGGCRETGFHPVPQGCLGQVIQHQRREAQDLRDATSTEFTPTATLPSQPSCTGKGPQKAAMPVEALPLEHEPRTR